MERQASNKIMQGECFWSIAPRNNKLGRVVPIIPAAQLCECLKQQIQVLVGSVLRHYQQEGAAVERQVCRRLGSAKVELSRGIYPERLPPCNVWGKVLQSG